MYGWYFVVTDVQLISSMLYLEKYISYLSTPYNIRWNSVRPFSSRLSRDAPFSTRNSTISFSLNLAGNISGFSLSSVSVVTPNELTHHSQAAYEDVQSVLFLRLGTEESETENSSNIFNLSSYLITLSRVLLPRGSQIRFVSEVRCVGNNLRTQS